MKAVSPYHRLMTEPKFGRAKRIKVWLNGEAHCYEFNINPKDFRSWTAILFHITDVIKPQFGAVRNLLALGRRRFVDNFEDLEPSEKYIALGKNCQLKVAPGGYNSFSVKDLVIKKNVKKKLYTGEVSFQKLPFLMETKKKNLTIVYMVVNGRRSQVPQKAVFTESEMKTWDVIYRYSSKILDIPEGVENICSIFGDILKHPDQFQHGYVYVAIPFTESFVKMDYLNLFKSENNFRSNYHMIIKPGPDQESVTSGILSSQTDSRSSAEARFTSMKRRNTCSDLEEALWSKNSLNPSTEVQKPINNVTPIAMRIKEEISKSIKAYEKSISNLEKQIFSERKKCENMKSKTTAPDQPKPVGDGRGNISVEFIYYPQSQSENIESNEEMLLKVTETKTLLQSNSNSKIEEEQSQTDNLSEKNEELNDAHSSNIKVSECPSTSTYTDDTKTTSKSSLRPVDFRIKRNINEIKQARNSAFNRFQKDKECSESPKQKSIEYFIDIKESRYRESLVIQEKLHHTISADSIELGTYRSCDSDEKRYTSV